MLEDAPVFFRRLNQALRASLEEKESECQHAKELLAAARSSALAAEGRGETWKNEVETAKVFISTG